MAEVNRKVEQDPGFEELQRYLMNSLQTPGSRVACPMDEEQKEEEAEEQ